MSFYVCIDIGGTAIKYGLAGENGVLVERGERPALARERIEFAEPGNDAGMIGALYLLLQRMDACFSFLDGVR